MTPLDDYLRLLANERRRRLLRSLWEDEPVSVATTDEVTRLRLYHVDLPKLADSGLVDWDPRTDSVARGQAFDDVVPLLEALDDERYRNATDGGENSRGENGESGATEDG